MVDKAWFVYLVQAESGALYCGVTTDPERRFRQHQKGQGARFFRLSPAQRLVYLESGLNRSEALRRERSIKALSRAAKLDLIAASTGCLAVYEGG